MIKTVKDNCIPYNLIARLKPLLTYNDIENNPKFVLLQQDKNIYNGYLYDLVTDVEALKFKSNTWDEFRIDIGYDIHNNLICYLVKLYLREKSRYKKNGAQLLEIIEVLAAENHVSIITGYFSPTADPIKEKRWFEKRGYFVGQEKNESEIIIKKHLP
jgi:hypothetical protein